ncbi:unnamed protein product [Lymnaea stagnalis]|uniref:Uncharacterized protein n=1 Tax=Lymnaea stagnalis TaxID=6523 RepID=A0AAV2IAH8_LYMST
MWAGLIVRAVLLFSLALLPTSEGGNPFSPGPYTTGSYTLTPKVDGIPLHTTVYHPQAQGTFPPIVFIGGMYGYMFAEAYSTFMADLASHGYIILGIDRINPPPLAKTGQVTTDDDRPWSNLEVGSVELYLNTTNWLRTHPSNTSAVFDWSRTVLMCHSAGCDDTLVMVNVSRSLAQASVHLDPMSVNSLILHPVVSRVKTLAYMSQLSEEKPECCIPGTDYRKIYDLMTCVKVRMQVKDFGHCDILNQPYWEACHVAKVCRTTNDTRLPSYRDFTTGVIDAFLQWTLDGNQDMERYVVNQTYMPLPLVDLAYDISC